jgi:hypothetical protein
MDDASPPGNELTAFLWIVATLIAVFELTWFFFDRIYSAA